MMEYSFFILPENTGILPDLQDFSLAA